MNTALLPVPRIQFSDANGVPLATYQDANGAAANTNPVVLDASGSASIWLSTAAYKIVLEDVNNVVQWTVDNRPRSEQDASPAWCPAMGRQISRHSACFPTQ
jgi:hypothetical protein